MNPKPTITPLPVVYQDWIKVEDALPNDGEIVFFVRYGSLYRGRWKLNPNPHFVGPSLYWHPSEDVTHWLPSPDPVLPVVR